MADNTVILKLKLEEAQAKVKIKSITSDLEKLDGRTKEYKLAVAKLNLEEQKLTTTRQKLSEATRNLIGNGKTGLTGTSKATGAATSAAMELGRVFSDAPYGIRGMANNLSQLASQFSFMSNKVDESTGKVVGFNGALKSFGKALKANAILLVIQAVISAFDYFANKVNDTDKALKKLAESTVSESITELTLLKKALEDSSKPLEEKQKLIKGAREEYEDFNDAIKDTPNDVLAAINALDLLTQKYKDFARAKALTELVTDAMKDQAKTLASYTGKWTDMFNSFDSFMLGMSSISGGKGFSGINQGISNDINEIDDTIKKYEEMLNQPTKSDPTKTYLELIYGSKGKQKEIKTTKLSPFKTPKELDLDVKNNEKALLNLEDKITNIKLKTKLKEELSEANTEEEKLKIRKLYETKILTSKIENEKKSLQLSKDTEIALAKQKTKNHIDELKRKYTEFVTELDYKQKLNKISKKDADALKGDATGKLTDSLLQADSELTSTVKEIENKYKPLFELYKKLGSAKLEALFSGFDSESAKEKKDKFKDALNEYLELYTKLAGAVGDLLQSEADRELTIEQNKTNVLNEELNKRLINENLSAEERKNIQNKILQNDEALRVKQNKIKKKAFDTQKALNISIGIADTIVAGIGAAKETKAGSFARIAAMTAVIGAGLSQVAIIARQKFQPEAANTPINAGGGGGASGGVGDRSFDFNLVGATQGNQVLDAIQGQFNKPVQAYVVSRDMTSQQQLDANIKNQASF